MGGAQFNSEQDWLYTGDLGFTLLSRTLSKRPIMAMFQMMGVFAEFERSMISERVKSGLARTKAKGTKLGRPMASPKTEAQILKLRSKGKGMLAIGKELGVGTSVVQRVVAQSD